MKKSIKTIMLGVGGSDTCPLTLTIEQTTHYYPYGGILTYSTNQGVQKYKYNGKELDRMHGLDWYDYNARQYDPAMGEFTSIDPSCEKYYNISPYAYCAGNPIRYVDPTGAFIVWVDEKGTEWKYNISHQSFLNEMGENYNGNNQFIFSLTGIINRLLHHGAGKKLIEDLVNRDEGVQIIENSKKSYESSEGLFPLDKKIKSGIAFFLGQDVFGGTDYTNLAHEMAHSQDRLNESMNNEQWFIENNKIVTKSEIYAMHVENLIRAENGLPLRQCYTETKGQTYSLGKTKITSLFFNSEGLHNSNYNFIKNENNRYVYKYF